MTTTTHGLRWDVAMTNDERRLQIMQSLTGILRERQLSSLTMQDIADRLGMAKGNLYNYFKNKQDLLYHCHIKAMENSFLILENATATTGNVSDRLRILMIGLANSVVEDPYGAVLTTDLESLSVSQRRHYLKLRDGFEQGVRALIADGIKAGEFAPTDVKLACFALLGSANWISRWYKPGGANTPEQVGGFFADLFLHGLHRTDITPGRHSRKA